MSAGTFAHCTKPVYPLDSPAVFVLYYPWQSNFRHFTLDMLPSLWWYFQLKEEYDHRNETMNVTIAVTAHFPRYGGDYLELLGIENIGTLQRDAKYSTVYIPSVTSNAQGSEATLGFQKVFALLRKRLMDYLPEGQYPKLTKRVYIRRKDAIIGASRALVNEEALFQGLTELGFEPFVGSKHNVTEKFKYFSNAKFVILESGSGIANFVLFPPGCTIIEICHPRFCLSHDQAKAESLGIKRVELQEKGKLIRSDDDGVNVPWTVDVKDVLDSVQNIVRTSERR